MGHWFQVDVPLGSVVRIPGERQSQIRQVMSGGSYASENDPRLHFGLGNAGTIDRVEIRWPGGQQQVIRGLPADRIYVFPQSDT